jgi:hypothetical protein
MSKSIVKRLINHRDHFMCPLTDGATESFKNYFTNIYIGLSNILFKSMGQIGGWKSN